MMPSCRSTDKNIFWNEPALTGAGLSIRRVAAWEEAGYKDLFKNRLGTGGLASAILGLNVGVSVSQSLRTGGTQLAAFLVKRCLFTSGAEFVWKFFTPCEENFQRKGIAGCQADSEGTYSSQHHDSAPNFSSFVFQWINDSSRSNTHKTDCFYHCKSVAASYCHRVFTWSHMLRYSLLECWLHGLEGYLKWRAEFRPAMRMIHNVFDRRNSVIFVRIAPLVTATEL